MFGNRRKRGCTERANNMPHPMVAVWIGVIGVLVLQLVVFCLVGGYTATFHLLRGYVQLFPLWLFGTLDWLCYATGGVVLGLVFCERRLYREDRFRCAFFLTLWLTFGYFWCALFFGAHVFLLAFLFSAITFLCSLCVLVCLGRTGGRAFFLQLGAALWLLYRFLLSLFCLFSI